jgi:hypothetical protein
MKIPPPLCLNCTPAPMVSPLPPTATDSPPSFCYYLRHGVLVPCEPTFTPVPTATPGPFVSPLVQPKATDGPAIGEQPTPAPPALPWSW